MTVSDRREATEAVRTFTLKSIPDDLYERLRQVARAHRRSINSQILLCLEETLGGRERPTFAEILERLRRLEERVPDPQLSIEGFEELMR